MIKKFYLPALVAVFMTNFALCSMSTQENQTQKCQCRTTELHRAASLPDTSLLRNLLSRRADVTARNNRGETPLHVAAAHGHLNAAQILIEYGAEIDALSTRTPLHLAIANNHFDVVRTLVQAGAQVTMQQKGTNRTCLHYAVISAQNSELVEFLINHNADDIDTPDFEGQTPLFMAIRNILSGENVEVNINIGKLLVQNGADVNQRNGGFTLLHIAAAAGNFRCAEFLVRHGANVNASVIYMDLRPLHLAICSPIDRKLNGNPCVIFTTQSRFQGKDFIPSVYYFPALNEYRKIVTLLRSAGGDAPPGTAFYWEKKFYCVDTQVEIDETALHTAADLPSDLNRLTISFERNDPIPRAHTR